MKPPQSEGSEALLSDEMLQEMLCWVHAERQAAVARGNAELGDALFSMELRLEDEIVRRWGSC